MRYIVGIWLIIFIFMSIVFHIENSKRIDLCEKYNNTKLIIKELTPIKETYNVFSEVILMTYDSLYVISFETCIPKQDYELNIDYSYFKHNINFNFNFNTLQLEKFILIYSVVIMFGLVILSYFGLIIISYLESILRRR
jgi:hypothetical protein